ncbi:heme o synthase [Roseicyclus sp. F158]|uniref:Protoheme IX farnesyltransferase n=1 Tax=Tropicimonas omnivorans TaxID=3075590 RepID=A0ABU3DF85_9RHOB|nr:heme o synthase [Roseicyclus sp. F158]MDT0682381.1 heme o synthase [Roseicyclus sp. F158]
MSDASLHSTPITGAAAGEPDLRDYFALLKPRVMTLVVFTALVGLVVAPVPVHPFVAAVSILFIAVGGGAAGALNMWWDADIDAKMRRTERRPVPSGRVSPGEALGLGLALSGISVVMLGLASNIAAGLFLAFTIFFYAVIYTMWLKRWTPQNIVIGGAAGAFPPAVGWVAATGGLSLEPVLLFLTVFLWTPPHFWALALFVKSDYADAGVPMLTVTHGPDSTRRHIIAYAVILAIPALAIAATPIGGPVYLISALALNAAFIRGAWIVSRRSTAVAEADHFAAEKGLFKLSLYYLFLQFGALLIDASLRSAGLLPAWGWL